MTGSAHAEPQPDDNGVGDDVTNTAPEVPPSGGAEDDPAAPVAETLSDPEMPDPETPRDSETLRDPEMPDPETLLAERDQYLDALRRLQADFDNFRKRSRSDAEMEVGRATEKIIADLLPVLDAFEMALAHESDPDGSPLAKMHDSLLTALERHGLERLHPADSPFDPNEAEAVIHEPGDGSDGDGQPMVSAVLRAGYRWRTRVMRPAMVKVRG